MSDRKKLLDERRAALELEAQRKQQQSIPEAPAVREQRAHDELRENTPSE